MFCDELKLKVIAGQGGDGCVSFRREKFVPKGGPDGGDGGIGGNIIFKVNSNLNTLSNLANRKEYKAEDGVNGSRKNMHGRNGNHLVLEVPPGTIIFNEDKSIQIADLSRENEEFIIVKGGKGGHGNARFVSSTHQAPRFAEKGEPGKEEIITLELKLVADVGLIGLPSAGKSTLISVISNARPKIAAYHFTTLTPNLGVVDLGENSFVVADIPGLIEGASQGKGLGHQFLRHISRTKLLVHIIDCTLPDIKKDYDTIIKELKTFDKKLAKLPQLIVLNKIDMISKEELAAKKKELKKRGILCISAINKEGLKELLYKIVEQLKEIKANQPEPEPEIKEIPVFTPHLDQEKFQIEKVIKKKDHKIFRITGERIEQLIVMTDTNNIEGLERIYHYLERMGIKREIEKLGATFGDIIKIKERKIPYRK